MRCYNFGFLKEHLSFKKYYKYFFYLISSIFIIIIFFLLLSFCFSYRIFAFQVKYYEFRDLRLLFNFYNEINEFDVYNYTYYYKVFYEDKKIIKYEFYSYDSLDSIGEYSWSNNNIVLIIKKVSTNLSTGKPILKDLYKYEIVVENGKIKEYVIYKYSETSGLTKVGISKFSYQSDLIITIENYFGSIYVGKIIIYFKSENEKVQEKIYDNINNLIEVRIYNNNALYQVKKYYYSKGKIIKIETYDSNGNLIATENK